MNIYFVAFYLAIIELPVVYSFDLVSSSLKSTNMAVLEVQNLSKSYGRIKALDQLNLTIEAGNLYGILGPNGSGKTTTLGVILDILKPDSGSYTWFDGAYGDKFRLRIGSILETPNFYPYMNAPQNLEIVRQIKKVDEINVDELLELVNLAHRKRSKFRTYSLGMKQRLAIAATLIGDPDVLIFDEPTNGLDPQGIAEVRGILTRIAGMGKSVIMASHILAEVEKICSHVAIIKKGRLLATGPVGAILSNDITIEVASEDMEQLQRVLSSKPYVTRIEKVGGWYECLVNEDVNVTEFSRALFNDEVTPTRLVARKRRLEEEFLEITKNG